MAEAKTEQAPPSGSAPSRITDFFTNREQWQTSPCVTGSYTYSGVHSLMSSNVPVPYTLPAESAKHTGVFQEHSYFAPRPAAADAAPQDGRAVPTRWTSAGRSVGASVECTAYAKDVDTSGMSAAGQHSSQIRQSQNLVNGVGYSYSPTAQNGNVFFAQHAAAGPSTTGVVNGHNMLPAQSSSPGLNTNCWQFAPSFTSSASPLRTVRDVQNPSVVYYVNNHGSIVNAFDTSYGQMMPMSYSQAPQPVNNNVSVLSDVTNVQNSFAGPQQPVSYSPHGNSWAQHRYDVNSQNSYGQYPYRCQSGDRQYPYHYQSGDSQYPYCYQSGDSQYPHHYQSGYRQHPYRYQSGYRQHPYRYQSGYTDPSRFAQVRPQQSVGQTAHNLSASVPRAPKRPVAKEQFAEERVQDENNNELSLSGPKKPRRGPAKAASAKPGKTSAAERPPAAERPTAAVPPAAGRPPAAVPPAAERPPAAEKPSAAERPTAAVPPAAERPPAAETPPDAEKPSAVESGPAQVNGAVDVQPQSESSAQPKQEPVPKPKSARAATLKKETAASSQRDASPSRDTMTGEDEPQIPITDFFYFRRTARRQTSKELKQKREKEIEEKILRGCEDGLEVREIEGKGRGVMATRDFKKGDFVVEYAGDLIDMTTAKQREDLYSKDEEVGCYMYYFAHKNKQYCIDATAESGKLGRLLNHSRKGNCHTKVFVIGGHPYLVLLASRDITEGEELTYDYGERSQRALESHPWLKH